MGKGKSSKGSWVRQKEMEVEERVRIHANNSKTIASVVNRFIVVAGSVTIVFFIMHYSSIMVSDLAGKSTEANILFKFLSKIGVSRLLPIGAGIGGVAYGFGQKALRKKEINRLSNEVDFYKKRIDPNKGSSYITDYGETRGEDKW